MDKKWLCKKNINYEKILEYIKISDEKNQFTNNGPCVKLLENKLKNILEIEETKAIIVVSNGACGLHAIGAVFNNYYKKKIKYTTQSFTFPSSAQGPFNNGYIIDIDEEGGPDIKKIPIDTDCLIVTNILGNVTNMDKYIEWSKKNNKLLIFDNAATAFTKYKNKNSCNYGNASIISLHHTKPIGFGEGGIIIIDKEYENEIRKMINFGYDMIKLDQIWLPEGNNYKMSDVSASFILMYLENFEKIKNHHQKLYNKLKEKIKNIEKVKLFPNFSDETPFISCFSIIFDKEIELYKSKFEIKKYYKPLILEGLSYSIWKRIICYPCNLDIEEKDLDIIIDEIKKYL